MDETKAMKHYPKILFSILVAAAARLALIHRTILARILATWLVRRKCRRANHRRQNREQDLRVILHRLVLSDSMTMQLERSNSNP